ncbi:hypothetical protein Tco_0170361, partial [Tanacetum coccineum]
RSIAKDAGDAPNKHPDLKTNGKPVDKEDQVFLDELERLKRQEKDANDAAEALRKEFVQNTHICTDISKIIKKQSKMGKHGHENGRVHKSGSKAKEKSTLSQIVKGKSNSGQLQKTKPKNNPL